MELIQTQIVTQNEVSIAVGETPVLIGEDQPANETASKTVNFLRSGCWAVQILFGNRGLESDVRTKEEVLALIRSLSLENEYFLATEPHREDMTYLVMVSRKKE